MAIGILGGTFNPIHYGHLVAANEILEKFRLEKVILIPAAKPPHKDDRAIIDPHHRLIMAVLATVSNPALIVSPMEIEREGISYSIETLRRLRQLYGAEVDLYFIAGIDAFLDVSTWKDVDQLFQQCHFIVISRPGYDTAHLLEVLGQTVSAKFNHLRFELTPQLSPFGTQKILISETKYCIFLTGITALDISSSEIRRRVREGRSIRYLLPKSVEDYIMKHRLYQGNDEI